MNRALALKRAYLKRENKLFGASMALMSGPYPVISEGVITRVWRSRDYLAQLVDDKRASSLRLSINRTMLNEHDHWEDGIPWEDLQRIKNECLGPDVMAVEVYPPEKEVVNVANIRHLFVVAADIQIGWRDSREADGRAV